jgi:hypothetical protein
VVMKLTAGFVITAELPQRFITLFFDDLHLSTQDAMLSRQAAVKLLGVMQTGDRLSIYTTSGQVQQDFTADRGKFEGTLQPILPRPLSDRGFSDESGDVIDRATKANVVINSIDARGLYVSSVFDVANGGSPNPLRTQFVTMEESIQSDVLAEFADGTGGTFFHNRNDIDQGLLQAAQEPEVSYVLGFTPQSLKLDGKYHHLKVALTNKQKWNLQARHGYFAPRGDLDPATVAREEIHLVRIVVRDSEGAQMAALNRGVVIPY